MYARAQAHLLSKWEARTGEVLLRGDVATHLFGDRKPMNEELRPELDEAFHTIQAMLNHITWQARNNYKHHKGPNKAVPYAKISLLTRL